MNLIALSFLRIPSLFLLCLFPFVLPLKVAQSDTSAVGKQLAHAFRDGDVAVRASSQSGHSIALLEIRNMRTHELVVDVNGSYLISSPVINGSASALSERETTTRRFASAAGGRRK